MVTWTSLLDLHERHLIARFGSITTARGQAYFAEGSVMSMRVDGVGTRVEADVRGQHARSYRVTVALPSRDRLITSCSCPVGSDCKHAVCAILAAQNQLAPELLLDPAASQPSDGAALDHERHRWRQLLAPALQHSARASSGGRALALVITVHPHQYGGPSQVQLTPMIEGRRDSWIKSGVSWTALLNGQAAPGGAASDPGNPRQLRALEAIASAVTGRGYYYSLDRVSLGDLGCDWPRLLTQAVEAGVTLLLNTATGRQVWVAAEPGGFAWHLNPPEGANAGSVSLQVRLPPEALTLLEKDTDAVRSAPVEAVREISGQGGVVTGWVITGRQGTTVLVGLREPIPQVFTGLTRQGALSIPADDWTEFVTVQIPTLANSGEILVPQGYELPTLRPTFVFSVAYGEGHSARVLLSWDYGADDLKPISVPLWAEHNDHPFRDQVAEAEILTVVEPLLDESWREAASGRVRPARELWGPAMVTLAGLLDSMRRLDLVEVRESGVRRDYVEAVDGPAISISTRDSADPDWFDLSVEVHVAGELVPLAELIAALTHEEPVMLLESGLWFTLDRPELEQLRAILHEAQALQDKHSEGLRLSIVQAGMWEELVSLGVVAEQSQRWESAVGALTGLTVPDEITAPEGLTAQLRPYQLEGLRWLAILWEARLGGVLADDMGLGKTMQTLAMAQRAHEAGDLREPILIVCPTSVMTTWAAEAATFAPELRVRVVGETRKRSGTPMAAEIDDAQVVITSYALLRLDAEAFHDIEWSALVLDEAQFVKNHRSQVYAAARKLRRGRTFALSGTPLENSLMDLWSLLSLTAPGLYPRPDVFTELYRNPIEKGGDVERLATLRRRIRPLMLRRTKQEVASELPPKQEQILKIAMAPKHRAIYERHLARERQRVLGLVDDMHANRIQILRALTALRQLALDPGLVDPKYVDLATPAKLELLAENLVELAAEGHRALVFSQFTGFLKQARQRLQREGLNVSYLDGRTRNRANVIDQWRSGDDAAFLISLKAGGFGLTLTEADYVYVLDPWWNPAAEMQAVDRVHRIGQTKPVNVYRLVSSDSIEEKVVALQQRKRELFERVVDDGAVMTGALTAEDIRSLLDG